MAIRALIHIISEDPVLGELDEMPDPTHTFLRVRNATKKDGKPLDMIDARTTSIAYPWSRITYVEFFNEDTQREVVMGFFRENA
ncbi:MAG TPA: hypothetical protein VKZ96_09265 [Thermomicrobiales bacterium]|nr:hypothetical protein [Thermomicrobiales bacterium]